jgi:hypothetical protein
MDWDYKKISKQKSKLEKQEAKTNRLLGDEVTANISKMFDTMRKEQLERDARSKYLDELLRQKEERDRESQTPKKLKIGVKRINETETAIKNQEKTIRNKKKQILNEQEYLNTTGRIMSGESNFIDNKGKWAVATELDVKKGLNPKIRRALKKSIIEQANKIKGTNITMDF